MRLFKRRKKEKSINVIENAQETPSEVLPEEEVRVEKENVNIHDRAQRVAYISHLHEQIQEAKRECVDIKFEYGQVTSKLKDIQLIDMAPEEESKVLLEIAQGIADLTKERNQLGKREFKITDNQKRMIETYEDSVAKDVDKLQKQENYLTKVKNDLRQLAAEKSSLLREQKELVSKQGMLQVLSKCLAAIMIALMVLVAVVWKLFQVDIAVPFLSLIGFGLVVAIIIIFESGRNRRGAALAARKRNRAVYLSNKIKIKYVNTIKVIDYMCAKYSVRNGMELDFVYGQYRQWKAEMQKQQESTRLLGEYNTILMHELDKLGVKDKDVWFFQAQAIVDPREMVEIRHDLNTRRQKLRERLDYNSEIMEECLAELETIRTKKEEYAQDVEEVLGNDIRGLR